MNLFCWWFDKNEGAFLMCSDRLFIIIFMNISFHILLKCNSCWFLKGSYGIQQVVTRSYLIVLFLCAKIPTCIDVRENFYSKRIYSKNSSSNLRLEVFRKRIPKINKSKSKIRLAEIKLKQWGVHKYMIHDIQLQPISITCGHFLFQDFSFKKIPPKSRSS